MRLKSRFLTSVAVLCAPFAAQAEGILPDWASIQIGSKHVNMNAPAARGGAGFNEFNPGLIFTWENRWGGLNYSIGSFRNSFDEQSTLLAVSDLYPLGNQWFAGWFLGAADYGDTARNSRFWDIDSDWIPVAGLQLNYRNYYLQALPANDSADGFGMVFTFGVSFSLNRGDAGQAVTRR